MQLKAAVACVPLRLLFKAEPRILGVSYMFKSHFRVAGTNSCFTRPFHKRFLLADVEDTNNGPTSHVVRTRLSFRDRHGLGDQNRELPRAFRSRFRFAYGGRREDVGML